MIYLRMGVGGWGTYTSNPDLRDDVKLISGGNALLIGLQGGDGLLAFSRRRKMKNDYASNPYSRLIMRLP